MKFQSFDKNTCKQFRNELQAVLDKFGEGHNLTMRAAGISYSDSSLTVKVEATVIGGTSIQDQKTESQLSAAKIMAEMRDLQMEKNGRKIVGYNSRAYKRPWIITQDDKPGKQFVCDDSLAKAYFS